MAQATQARVQTAKPYRVERSRLHAQWPGKYLIHPRGRGATRPKANWCRLQRATADVMAFVGLHGGSTGDTVSVQIPNLGILRGRIIRTIGALMMMEIDIEETKRRKLDAKIGWLDRRHRLHLPENRRSVRFEPKNPEAVLCLPDGTPDDCYIMDLSSGGAFVTSGIRPRVGDTVMLGRVSGKVLRCTDEGFAVRFLSQHSQEEIEQLVGSSSIELL